MKRERPSGAEIGECKRNLGSFPTAEGHRCGIRFGIKGHDIGDKAHRTSSHVSYEVETDENNFWMATVGLK